MHPEFLKCSAMLDVLPLALPDVKLLRPKPHHDARGFLVETFHEKRFADLGPPSRLVQENQSLSLRKGTVRGLHAQRSPQAQAKFVRVLRGKIYDVAVDVRPDSPTYGQHVGVELSEDDVAHLLVPVGFLHGFCTLTDNAVVSYKLSEFYVPGSEIGVVWNDPDLGIQWPIDPAQAILSDKDARLGAFKDFPRLDW